MATVTGLTAARMLGIEAGSVIGGSVNASGHLILTKHDGSTIDAGYMLVDVATAYVDSLVKGNNLPAVADLNAYHSRGTFFQNTNAGAFDGNNYPMPYAGALEVMANLDETIVWQKYSPYAIVNPSTFFRRVFYLGVWSAWTRFDTLGNTGIYAINAYNASVGKEILNAADLNSLVDSGMFTQTSNAEAASGTNYPVPLAGLLEVFRDPGSINLTPGMVWQRYTPYGDGAGTTYIRSYYSGLWWPWKAQVSLVNGPRGWLNLGLKNGWTAYGGTFGTPAWRIDSSGAICLRGLMKTGAVGVFCSLGAGWGPESTSPTGSAEIYTVTAGGGTARIDVSKNGDLAIVSYVSPGSNAYVSLAGIRWWPAGV